jgi:5'-nucleotidase / UDP-sugar diphosphatase
MTPGNHELAYIGKYTRIALEKATFPILAANIEIKTKKLPQFDDFVNLKTKTGRTISVLGITNHNALKRGVVQKDFLESAESFMFLRDEADVLLVLSHIGLNNDKMLAERFPQIDLIIGGHSHSLLKKSILVNNVLIAQTGGSPHVVSDSHPVYLGVVTLVLENGKPVSKEGKVYLISAD